ncbi:PAS domain S-box protein [Gemmata sp. JC673]|uniref:histidine kinase n=1 Tax=Gemmata algarum TaxID=2975278 RepID=A0ABU5EZS0_9BACT|nr:PAS domain S-box protein [Gemmata algarum]MDY3560423.1 PAS domain S-box protein [Gemmata algarum]
MWTRATLSASGLALSGRPPRPARIAWAYLLFGLAWIWLTDRAVWAGARSDEAFWLSSGKGTAFVLLSALLVFYLARRELETLAGAGALLRAVADGTTDAVFVKDLNGRYLLLNEAAAQFAGRPVAELLGRDDTALFDPASARMVRDHDRRVMAANRAETTEEELTTAGVTRTFLATKAPYRNEHGEVIGLVGISRDITDRKDAERELRAERDRFQRFVEAVPLVLCSFRLRPDGTTSFLYSSPRIEGIYGIGPAALARDAAPISELIHPDDRDRVRSSIEESARGLFQWREEFRVRPPGRDELWIEGRSAPEREADGSTVWHGYIADITARKRTEHALQATRDQLREALRVARLGSWTWDEVAGRSEWSEEAAAVLGFPAAAGPITLDSLLSLVHPDDRGAILDQFAAARVGSDRFATDLRVTTADRVQWVHCQARAARGTDGRLTRLDGLVQDITDRMSAAVALRDRERLLAIVTSAARVGLVVVNDRYEYLFANDTYAAVLGIPPDQIVGRRVPDLLSASWPQIKPHLDRALAGEYVSYELEREPLPGGAGWRTLRVMYEPRPKDGRQTAVVVVIDQTEQKQAETAIRESEERFRTLVGALPDAVYINAGGRVAFCNPACVRLFGAPSPDALIGKTPFELMHPDDHEVIRRQIAAITASGTSPPEIEERAVRLDGTAVPVLVTAIAITDHAAHALLVVLRDLTEQKRAERQLRYQELMLREAAELAHVGGWGFDPVTFEGDWTPVVATIHDLPPDAPAPKPARGIEFYVEEDRPRIAAAVRAATESGTPYDLELQLVSAHGALKWVRTIARPIVEDGRVVRVRGSLQDITDRKRAEAEIRSLNAELEQRVRDRTADLEAANADLEAFSYSVSHDLRAPLRAIDGFSQIVLDEYGPQLPADAREYLADVCANTLRMGQLVDDLLTFSRLGRQPVRRQTVNTTEMVAGCLDELLRQTGARRIEIRSEELPPCDADPALLRQVWLNLLANALKYSSLSSPAVIEVGATGSPDGPVYYVRDNGVGFDMRYAHKLFGVFQRLHRAEDYEGTGIGLALVQRIVHRHGGRVWADSEPGEWAMFSFTLGRPPSASPGRSSAVTPTPSGASTP